MGLWSFLTGVNLEEEQKRGDEADARLAQLNRDALTSGRWSQSQFNQAESNRIQGSTGDVVSSVEDAAIEGSNDWVWDAPVSAAEAAGRSIKEGFQAGVNAYKETVAIPGYFISRIVVLGLIALLAFFLIRRR